MGTRTHMLQRQARRLAIGVLASIALVIGVAGPAAAATSARQLLNQAWSNAEKAKSVTISGSGTSSGQKFALHITASSKGDAQGWVSVGGNKLYIVKVGPEGYFKAGAAFWRAESGGTTGNATATLFANKWLKASGSNSPLASFNQFLGVKGFFTANPTSQLSNVTVKHGTYFGFSVYKVQGSQDGQTGTVVVSASSPHYPLAIMAPGSGTLTFSSWGKSVTVHAPHGAIDFNQLAGS